MKIYYKKMTVPVTMDTTLDKLEGNLYTPTGNLVLTICWTLKAFLCLESELNLEFSLFKQKSN